MWKRASPTVLRRAFSTHQARTGGKRLGVFLDVENEGFRKMTQALKKCSENGQVVFSQAYCARDYLDSQTDWGKQKSLKRISGSDYTVELVKIDTPPTEAVDGKREHTDETILERASDVLQKYSAKELDVACILSGDLELCNRFSDIVKTSTSFEAWCLLPRRMHGRKGDYLNEQLPKFDNILLVGPKGIRPDFHMKVEEEEELWGYIKEYGYASEEHIRRADSGSFGGATPGEMPPKATFREIFRFARENDIPFTDKPRWKKRAPRAESREGYKEMRSAALALCRARALSGQEVKRDSGRFLVVRSSRKQSGSNKHTKIHVMTKGPDLVPEFLATLGFIKPGAPVTAEALDSLLKRRQSHPQIETLREPGLSVEERSVRLATLLEKPEGHLWLDSARVV